MYALLKPLLFSASPEWAHDRTLGLLRWASQHPTAYQAIASLYGHLDPRLTTRVFGLEFPNPVGLAAGFDKNAEAVAALSALGFGCVEVGSVTAVPQEGNPSPRLFRFPQQRALINRMGFNNRGCEEVAVHLEQLRATPWWKPVPVGINLGKSRAIALEDAPADYLTTLQRLWPLGDYFVLNVSSPNTPGLRQLQDAHHLQALLQAVMGFARQQTPSKPVLLKLAPDLGPEQLDQVVELALVHRLAGLVATNTTVTRPGFSTTTPEGGLSGHPLAARSLEVLRYLVTATGGRLPLVSVGGIFTARDAFERLEAGASLVQVYTGLVYQGPGLARLINRGLLSLGWTAQKPSAP